MGNDHMSAFMKWTKAVGCASLVFTLPMLAAATGNDHPKDAVHFVSSGRAINAVPDMTAEAHNAARARIWAMTQSASMPSCAESGGADASCFDTFQTGAVSH
jgi:hypothetical protein